MSVVAVDPDRADEAVVDPAGFLVGYPGEFSWSDFAAAGWIGDELLPRCSMR